MKETYANYISNIDNVYKMVNEKKSDTPIHITYSDGELIKTPYNVFPYTKWYKGEYLCSKPIVADREAGYRKINNYNHSKIPYIGNSPFWFQGPCSVLLPTVINKIGDKDKLEINIPNKCCNNCIVYQ